MATKRQKSTYRMFMRMCPWLEDKVVDWWDYDDFMVRVILNDGTAAEYDELENCFMVRRSVEDLDAYHTGDTEEKWRLEFATRMNKRMHHLGINQDDLSKITGISQGTIARYVNCSRTPSSYNLKKIAQALRCTTDFLSNF